MSIDISNNEFNEATQEFKEDADFAELEKLLTVPQEHISAKYVDSLLNRKKESGGEVMMGDFINEDAKSESEKILLIMARDNHPDMLSVFNYLDDEENAVDLVKKLEEKYNFKNENLEVAGLLIDFTNLMWKTTRLDVNELFDQEIIANKLPKILELAKQLEKYSLLATHQSRDDVYIEPIRSTQELTSSGPADFEGAGVYAGILGGFMGWGNQENTFKFKVSLADTLPIITSRQNPEAMVVVLGDCLDIHGGVDFEAKPIGVIRWMNDDLETRVNDFQLTKIQEVLDCKAKVVNIDRADTVILETDLSPIVWASAARMLHIGRAMPQKEFDKIGH